MFVRISFYLAMLHYHNLMHTSITHPIKKAYANPESAQHLTVSPHERI
jgi:hypothetical protein